MLSVWKMWELINDINWEIDVYLQCTEPRRVKSGRFQKHLPDTIALKNGCHDKEPTLMWKEPK